MLYDNLEIKNDRLFFAGRDTVELAEKYGTPLYLMDEERIRENCRSYREALKGCLCPESKAIYASKACCFGKIYKIIAEEGLGADVVSPGEIYTAYKAGFPMENAYFQGNNKTDGDIELAMDCGVGYFVCDGTDELDAVDKIAAKRGAVQKILLRVTPGIDPHTYDEVATGKVDSKFGVAIETGQALEAVRHALSKKNLSLEGIHCHVGSMVFDSDVFIRSAAIMTEFIGEMKKILGFEAKILDLGGGYGVKYYDGQGEIDIPANIRLVAKYVAEKAKEVGVKVPSLRLEPGRSIVADAGITLYTVGSVKKITGYKNYVSVDGGMTDNPRYALYGSRYTVLTANKPEPRETLAADLVGRCCESGDIIQPAVEFPADIGRGDIVAVLTTGAYNYSMASNYNRVPRPPVVMLSGGSDYVAVKRETPDDLIMNDVLQLFRGI